MAGFGWTRRRGQDRAAEVVLSAVARSAPVRGDDVDIGFVFRILARRWLFILLTAALFVGVAAAYVTTAPKTWRATARVLLDPRDKQVVGPGLIQPVQGVDLVWIDTQADLVTSAVTLSSVVGSQKLADDPEFGGAPEEALRKLAESVLVERADQTYVLNISVTTRSPEKSARLAQAVADAFVASIVTAKTDAVRQANQLLGRQLDELREKAREADEKLQDYKRRNNIVAASGRLVDEETLRQLNESYVSATVRTREARSRHDRIQAATENGGEAFDSTLDSINSAVISRLKIEHALAEKQVAELAQELGPSHPRMIAARADVERTDALMRDELRSLAATAEADYDVALANEKSIKQSLDEATDIVNASGDAGITLRELENEALVRRDLYRGFVSRLEQTSLQENTQISDARVIVPAQVPLYPYSPRKSLILALAMIAGIGAGLSGALYRGRADLIAMTMGVRREPPMDPAEPAEAPVVAATSPIPRVPTAAAPASAESPSDEPVEAAATGSPSPPESPARPDWSHPEIRVLAEVMVDTATSTPGRHGRPIARAPRERVTSAVESASGRPIRAGLDALGRAVRSAETLGGGLALTIIFGTAAAEAVAAVGFGFASAAAEGDRRVLLVDGGRGAPLADALFDEPTDGLLEVLLDEAAADGIARQLDDADVTLVPLAGPDGLPEVHAERLAAFVEALAEDFDHTVVHLGARVSPSLMAALADVAGAVLLVADAAVEADPEAARLIEEIAAATPAFGGVVLVRERRPADSRREAAA